jgi:hypothetical protein
MIRPYAAALPLAVISACGHSSPGTRDGAVADAGGGDGVASDASSGCAGTLHLSSQICTDGTTVSDCLADPSDRIVPDAY